MVRLIKLKYAININLTTLDVTYNPDKHNWYEKTKKNIVMSKKNIKFKQIWNATQGILGTSVYGFSL